MKQLPTSSRDEVLDTVRRMPNGSAGAISREVGLTTARVLQILSVLNDDGLVQWKVLPPEPGVSRAPRRGYFAVDAETMRIPKAWDVLAHFFGRIEEPAAA